MIVFNSDLERERWKRRKELNSRCRWKDKEPAKQCEKSPWPIDSSFLLKVCGDIIHSSMCFLCCHIYIYIHTHTFSSNTQKTKMAQSTEESVLDKLLKTRYPLTYYLSRQQQFIHSYSTTPSTIAPVPSGMIVVMKRMN